MNQQTSRVPVLYQATLVLALLLTVMSCRKKETVPYDRVSNNTILTYRVSNITDTLYGAIDNNKNTITVYIPYYAGIGYIVPEITLDKNAQLLDGSGKVINPDGGIDPVPVDTTGYIYTVMGSDSVKRRYTLIIDIAPMADSLKAGYTLATINGISTVDAATAIQRNIYGRLPIYGNFGSTSTNAQFTLTNRATGKIYTNVFQPYQVTPGNNYYTMLVDISADADSGYYKAEMKHQGRTTQLPDIHLVYAKPAFANLKSTSAYAAGDTVTFAAKGHNTSDNLNGSIIGLKRVYLKFWKAGFTYGGKYPATFPDSLFGQKVEMKILSVSRTEVKVIWPDLPDAATGSYQYSITFDYPGLGFYFDFEDNTGWGTDNMLATIGLLFTIKPKQ